MQVPALSGLMCKKKIRVRRDKTITVNVNDCMENHKLGIRIDDKNKCRGSNLLC